MKYHPSRTFGSSRNAKPNDRTKDVKVLLKFYRWAAGRGRFAAPTQAAPKQISTTVFAAI
jgi:hypothetical protein